MVLLAPAIVAGYAVKAAEHLRRCVEQDPKYSAAWKLLGKALQAEGDLDGARTAWTDGLAAAQAHGDKQAEKEMTVFLRKLDKAGRLAVEAVTDAQGRKLYDKLKLLAG